MTPKLLFLYLLFTPFVLSSQTTASIDPGLIDDLVRKSDLRPMVQTIHPVARQAQNKGEKPASFSGVSYTLNPNVKILNPTQLRIVEKQMTVDGLLSPVGPTTVSFNPDTVYFDPVSTLIFQPIPLENEQLLLVRPSISKVFSNLELPRQEVPLKLANTVYVASDANGQDLNVSATGANESYAVNLKFNKNRFTLKADKKDSLVIILTGEIILENPRVEGHYSKNNGYALIFKTSERINLEVEGKMSFGKETEIPLWGTEIEAGKIGKCKLTLAIAISIDGQITLVSNINQEIDLALGAKGGTFWYFPTSVNRVAELQQYTDVDLEIKTKMTAFAGLKAAANITFKGYNVLDLYVKGGMEGSVETQGTNLHADVGVRIKSGGKIVSKKFTLYDKYVSLWKYQTINTAGYEMQVHEACAFGDYVAGEIIDANGSPYMGQLEIRVKKDNVIKGTYTSITNDKGIFIYRDIPLRKGDMLSIKVPGSPSYSSEVAATIPFKEISLLSADYYSETATLIVAASRSEWAKQASSMNQVSGRTTNIARGVNIGGQGKPIMGSISQSDLINRIKEFNNNLITYSGPVTFWVKGDLNQRVRREDLLRGNLTGSPLAISKINGLNFKPGQYVQAQIEVEGFTITSEWVQTEGLLISPVEHIDFSFRRNLAGITETYSSGNSFVIVSALDASAPTPTGTVKLLKGFDSPHSAPTQVSSIEDFPEARRAMIWYNKSTSLVPVKDQQGVSTASTGPWSLTVGYSDRDFVLPSKNGKHPFEKVSYLFKDKDLGYNYFINECQSCSSPQNLVNLISTNKDLRDAIVNQAIMPSVKVGPNIKTTGAGRPVR